MKLKLTWLLTLFMAFVMQFSFAQEKTVTGTVTTATDGLPLPGASVIVKGTSRGQQTDFDGKFTILVNPGDVLVISYVGMTPGEITIDGRSTYDVALEDANSLDEVVIVGYGTSTKKAFAGTASTVSAENIEAKSFSNVSQALAGEVAGVNVINASGQPGTIGTVRIRGYGSPLGNRDPLYVVDGIPFSGTFDLNSINPNDIKTTTVLKDATATAIYGSRGANGVVLITTRNGSSTNSYIEVEVKSGVNENVIPRYDVLTSPEQYIGLVWEGLYNGGVVNGEADPTAYANGRLLGDNGIGAGYNMWDAGTNGDASALIDPATRSVRQGVNRLFTPERYGDVGFKTGYRTEANLQMGGGNEKTQYYVSAGFLDDQGYSINSDYKRYTTRINLKSDIKEWLDVNFNLGYAYSDRTANGQIVGSENIFEFADKMAPIYPVFARYPNSGELILDPIFGGAQYDYGTPTGGTTPDPSRAFTRARPNANLLNPIGSAVYDYAGRQTHALNGNFNANFKIAKGLTFQARFGGQYNTETRPTTANKNYGTGANPNGTIDIQEVDRWSRTFLQLLRYETEFGDHSLEVLAAHESFEQRADVAQHFKENVIVPGDYTLGNYSLATGPSIGYSDASAIESYFSQANYNYDGKYYLTGSVRTDGSSRFVNDQWGVFGSIGAAWVVSEEDFMDNSPFSFLKAKVSYGITGDQEGVTTASGFTTYNNTFIGALSLPESRPGNPDLTWETSKMFQTGLEMSLGNYLDINIDYYSKFTDNLFQNQRVGPSAGYSSILVNDGEVRYNGLEFDITGHVINTNDFKLDLAVNGEFLGNEFVTLPIDVSSGQEKIIDTSSSPDGNYAYAVGRSVFDFWMREWAGVDPSNGAPLWYQYYDDKNSNGVLDAGEESFSVLDTDTGLELNSTQSLYEYKQLVSDANIRKTITSVYGEGTQVFLDKSLIPTVRGAMRLSAKYKGFDLSTQFTYSLGGYGYDAQYAELMSDRFGAAGNNYHSDILARWQQPGDITNIPLLSDNAIINSTSASDRFIVSTDYFALNNARLGYTLRDGFLENSGIDMVNLWVSGDNLFIKTKRDGFNPSVQENGSSARRIYAPATTVTLGVRVKF